MNKRAVLTVKQIEIKINLVLKNHNIKEFRIRCNASKDRPSVLKMDRADTQSPKFGDWGKGRRDLTLPLCTFTDGT